MKRAIRAFVTGVLAILVLSAGATPAAAAAPQTNTRIDIPEFAFFDPCTGEAFVGGGSIHLLMKSSTSAELTRFLVHVNSSVHGTGVATQKKYVFTEVTNVHGTSGTPFPLTIHDVLVVHEIAQGNLPDFHLHVVTTIAFDASGQLTLQDVKINTTCGGEPAA